MAVAAISQLRRNVGFMFRETGQALDRLGMSVMADYAYKEPREFSLSLMMACPRAAGAAARRAGRGGHQGRASGDGQGLGYPRGGEHVCGSHAASLASSRRLLCRSLALTVSGTTYAADILPQ